MTKYIQKNNFQNLSWVQKFINMSNGKNKITFYYLPHQRVAVVHFGVQTSDSDYDRSGLPSRVPSVPGKRCFFVLHFNLFFINFNCILDFLWGIFEFLGLRLLAQVSGTDPRQWHFISKWPALVAQSNFPLEIFVQWMNCMIF